MRKYYTIIPNILTILRILSAPVLFYMTLLHDSMHYIWDYIPFILLFAFGTDFLDGYLAKKWNTRSHIGAILDPIADKILVIILLLAASSSGLLTGPGYIAAIIIIIRELIISGAREYGARYKISLPSSRLAKWKTFMQMVGLFVLFAEHHLISNFQVKLGEFLLLCAAIITFVTGVEYISKMLRRIRSIT